MFIVHHEFKTDLIPFLWMWSGKKKADFRNLLDPKTGFRRDTPQVGQLIKFCEWDEVAQEYTGRSLTVRTTHVQDGYGMGPDCVMISFQIEKFGTVSKGVPA